MAVDTRSGDDCIAVASQVPFLSASHFSVYDFESNRIEPPLFQTIVEYRSLLDRYHRTKQRVRTWYPRENNTLLSVASSNLLATFHDPWTGPGLPIVGEAEQRNVANPDTRYILLIDVNPATVAAGVVNLRGSGVQLTAIEQHQWGASPLTVYAQLVRIER